MMKFSLAVSFVIFAGWAMASAASKQKSKDECKGKWKQVFRGISGNGERINQALSRRFPENCTLIQGCLPDKVDPGFLKHQTRHLTSPLLSQWKKLKIIKAKLELYKAGQVVVKLVFNAYQTSSISYWFRFDKLKEWSFTDIYKGKCLGYFTSYYRYPFIMAQDSDCTSSVDDRNYFWMMIVDNNSYIKSSKCKFLKQSSYPAFLYAPNNVASQFNKGQYEKADEMAIYIQIGKYL